MAGRIGTRLLNGADQSQFRLSQKGHCSLNALVFYALVKLTEGGYSYWLYSLCRPLHEVDWTGMIVPSIKDQALVYGLPALIHGLCAPLLGATLMTVSRAASRRRG